MVLHGVDVSSHNAKNYKDAINSAPIVIIKATEGTSYVNPLLVDQSVYAESKKKMIGYYHFMSAGIDPVKQADYFLATIGNDAHKDGILLVLDYEYGGETNTHKFNGDEPKKFFDRIFEKTKKHGVFYTSWPDGNGRFDWSDIRDTNPLWYASYPYDDARPWTPELTQWAVDNQHGYWGKQIWMHQYTSVPWDRNVLMGSWEEFANKVGSKPAPKPQSFNIEDKVKLISKATHSRYGTKFADQAKKNAGIVVSKEKLPKKQSNSEYAYKVAIGYGAGDVHLWNVLEQDLTSAK